MTLREEIIAEKKGKGGAGDLKSVLRMQHLQNISVWAAGEVGMPSYAAFLGNCFGKYSEASGLPIDPSFIPCQRCEAILQPGFNCTVRIETNGAKVRKRRNKSYVPTKNIVVYTCHFCSNRNVKRGTPKHHMKEIFASELKTGSEFVSTLVDKKSGSSIKGSKKIKKPLGTVPPQVISKSVPHNSKIHPDLAKEIRAEKSAATPKERTKLFLSKGKKRKNISPGSKEQVENENKIMTPNAEKVVGESSRKRRKGWSSLKKIAETSGSENNRNISTIVLPFFM
ncbi:hypothetical protein IFM89_022241 [Coptis chinensis]|uniref:Uncharacterized protein n=1 Tax=Coptis chinensis TaxID=261450 RepID=A0A835GZ88_9MAGN|nr:hypothetical protein IFM89_022241 [Coptis chinensis]